ncbi:MAG: tetratricopeptide repeat protein [Nitrospirales bacterium]
MVPSSPSVAIVTSRQYFSLTEFGLKEPLRLDVLSSEEARELLRIASDKLIEFPDSKVDKLSELCGYLPLALRVSVSLLNDRPDWTLDTLLQRLEDERTRLQRLKRSDDADFDVEAAISLSYNLLPGKIQQRFLMLGVFPGPMWANPVAEVWMEYDSEDVDTCLGVLLTRSLLSSHSAPFGALGIDDTRVMSYYTFHDLTHLFALDRLRKNDEEFAVAVAGHAAFFLQLAIMLNEEYRKGYDHMAKAVTAFHAIWYDLFTAWYRIQSNQNDWPRPEQADIWISIFPNMCADLLRLLVRPTDRIKIIEPSLECARRLGDKLHEGVNLSNLGGAYYQLGEIEKAVELLQEAIPICSELDNPVYKTKAMLGLGTAYITLNKPDQAIELYEQALAKFDEIGDQQGRASIFTNLGSIYSQLGKVSKAKELYGKGLLISQEIGNRNLEAVYLDNLGRVYIELNEIDKAISFLEKALKITEELHDKHGQGKVLGSMGIAFSRLGEVPKALEFFEKQLETTHQTGDQLDRANALANIGSSYANLGDQRKALEFFEESLLIKAEIGNQRDEAHTLEQAGVAYWHLGDKETAKIFLRKALLIFTAFEDPQAQKIQKWLNDLESITVQEFVRAAIDAARTKKPEATEYFEAASKMERDQNIPEELQAVGKVLRDYLAGIKNPDLSRLREDFAQLIKEELEKSKDDIV